jgi:hypothetical protein
MPPFYDIYALSHKRDKDTIEKFLDFYCFREKVENREGQEIRVYKNDKYKINDKTFAIRTLSEVIDYGVNNPNQGYAFYISDNLKEDVMDLILKFTYDGKIIFGVSIEENLLTKEGKLIDNYNKAQIIERSMTTLTNSKKTSIQFEYPPSDDEEEFNYDIKLWSNMNNEKLRH